MEQSRTYSSGDCQIFFCDGKGWGIAPNLRTICLGNAEEILKEHPAGRSSLTATTRRTTTLNKGH